jgi:hypothetical protein
VIRRFPIGGADSREQTIKDVIASTEAAVLRFLKNIKPEHTNEL